MYRPDHNTQKLVDSILNLIPIHEKFNLTEYVGEIDMDMVQPKLDNTTLEVSKALHHYKYVTSTKSSMRVSVKGAKAIKKGGHFQYQQSVKRRQYAIISIIISAIIIFILAYNVRLNKEQTTKETLIEYFDSENNLNPIEGIWSYEMSISHLTLPVQLKRRAGAGGFSEKNEIYNIQGEMGIRKLDDKRFNASFNLGITTEFWPPPYYEPQRLTKEKNLQDIQLQGIFKPGKVDSIYTLSLNMLADPNLSIEAEALLSDQSEIRFDFFSDLDFYRHLFNEKYLEEHIQPDAKLYIEYVCTKIYPIGNGTSTPLK